MHSLEYLLTTLASVIAYVFYTNQSSDEIL